MLQVTSTNHALTLFINHIFKPTTNEINDRFDCSPWDAADFQAKEEDGTNEAKKARRPDRHPRLIARPHRTSIPLYLGHGTQSRRLPFAIVIQVSTARSRHCSCHPGHTVRAP